MYSFLLCSPLLVRYSTVEMTPIIIIIKSCHCPTDPVGVPPSHLCRLKVQPQLTELLRNLPISKDWAATGRLCSPRVLFVFQTQTLGPNAEDDGSSKSRSQVWL